MRGSSEDAESRASGAYIFRLITWAPGLTQQYDLRPDGDLSYPMGNVTATIVRGTQGGEVQVGSEPLSPMPR